MSKVEKKDTKDKRKARKKDEEKSFAASSVPCKLEIQTDQTHVVRFLVDALKEFLEDANLECDEDGVKIKAFDNSHTIFVECELNRFSMYHCDERLLIGVNMDKLYKVIKMINTADSIGIMVYEKTPDILQIVNHRQDGRKSSHTQMQMLDLDYSEFHLQDIDYSCVVSMKSLEFQQIIRNLHSIADDVEITKVGDTLTFATSGKCQFQHSITMREVDFVENQDPDEVFVGVFSLHHLNMFIKCTNLSEHVELSLKNDYLMMIRYDCGSLGYIRFAASPRKRK
jgi:proliferating cell nuclear antigen